MENLIYTIGNAKNYDKCFKEQKDMPGFPKKLHGGSVWQTYEEAKKHAELETNNQTKFSVYGVLADWNETKPSTDGDWNELLIDATLIQLQRTE